MRIQIPENTADLRGMRHDEAMEALENAMEECPQNSVLFVVHGQGTGRTKAAVQARLKKHPAVQSFKEDPNSAGGCTVVELKY
jgi:dsDNA-specific endonuclease/ATPase MutS2